jgi:signal transduction histidine kinase
VRAFGQSEVEVLFSDNGRGISSSVRREAFNPFFTTRRDLGCPGLGPIVVSTSSLSTAAASSRLMGGDVTVTSEAGKGSVFTLRLPGGEHT